MRHYATGWLLPDVLGALGPSALAAVPKPRRCAVGSYDTWWAAVWKSTFYVVDTPDTLVDFHTGGRSASPRRPDPSRSRGGF